MIPGDFNRSPLAVLGLGIVSAFGAVPPTQAAQGAVAREDVIEQVIVTAQLREENLADPSLLRPSGERK